MTDLETAARDAFEKVFAERCTWIQYTDSAKELQCDDWVEAFLAGAAHMQNKENELTQIIKWRDESIEELRQSIINERKRIEELEAELDNKRGAMTLEIHRLMKERDALKSRSEKLAECLDVALTLADKDLLTYERQRDHWRNALKEYGKEKYAKEEN